MAGWQRAVAWSADSADTEASRVRWSSAADYLEVA